MKQKYVVKLTETERSQLKELISSGEASARQIRRAYILLKSDSSAGGPNWNYQAICDAYEVSAPTVYNVRKNYTKGGLKGRSGARNRTGSTNGVWTVKARRT